jgi:hypothetical protein
MSEIYAHRPTKRDPVPSPLDPMTINGTRHRATDLNEFAELSADLTVIINRLIAEHEEIAGRWRFASKAKVEAADVLISRGKFLLAETYLNSAISNTPLVSSILTPLILLPSSVTSSILSSTTGSAVPSNPLHPISLISSQSGGGDISCGFWGQLRIWTLRKKLICARCLQNKSDYLLTTLSLLEPHLSQYLSSSDLLILQNDMMRNSVSQLTSTGVLLSPSSPSSSPSRGTGVGIGGETLAPPRLVTVSSDHHFSFTIMMNTPHHLRHQEPQYPCMTVTNTTKHLYDEHFHVRMARCIAGQPYVIYLRVTSEFPHPIEVDDITVTYTPFYPSQFGSPSPSSASPSQTNSPPFSSSSSPHRSSPFDCKPLPSLRNSNNKFILHPHDQFLELLFSPRSCGEYMLQKIVIRVGEVLFEKYLTHSDLNRLQQPFFSANIFITVTAPTQVFEVKTLVPTFTPMNQKDSFGIQIKTRPNDGIDSLFVKLSMPQSMSPMATLGTGGGGGIVSRDTNDLGSSRPEVPMAMPQLSKDTNFYESSSSTQRGLGGNALNSNTSTTTSTTTTTKMRSSSHSGPQTLRINASTPSFELSPAVSWIVKCLKYSSSSSSPPEDECPEDSLTLIPTLHSPHIELKVDGLLITNLSNTQELNLLIPFSFLLPSPPSRVLPQRYNLKYSLQGTLTRNKCVIEYEMSDSLTLLGGEQISIDQIPTELYGHGYFCQFIFTNQTKQSLRLLPYETSPYLLACNHYEIHDPNTSSTTNTEHTSTLLPSQGIPPEGIIISSSQKYYLGVYLEYHGAVLPPARPLPRTTQSFINPQSVQETMKKESERIQQILSAPPKLVELILSFQRHTVGGSDSVDKGRQQLMPLTSPDEYFNESLFKYSLTVSPPTVSPPALVPILKYDYHLHITVQPQRPSSARVTDSEEEEEAPAVLMIGEPVTCIYSLRVIYPPDSPLHPSSTAMESSSGKKLCLCVDASVGVSTKSSSPSDKWMVLGRTTRQVFCSSEVPCPTFFCLASLPHPPPRQNPIVSFPLQLLPIAPGVFSFPAVSVPPFLSAALTALRSLS